MPITYDRSICCNLDETISREWLVTNGLGGYAAGTIAGVLTRMEHGLLVASMPGMATPELLLAKIDEEVVFDQRAYFLGTNEYRDGVLNPSGFVHLETFRLEEGFPIFTYRLGGMDGIVLEKRIWMPQGLNTTYIQYRVLRTNTTDSSGYIRSGTTGALSSGYGRYHEYAETTQRKLALTLLPLVAQRPYDKPQHGNQDRHFNVQQLRSEEAMDIVSGYEANYPALLPKGVAGCTIRAYDGANPYHILAVGHPESQTTFIPTQVWYWNFLRRQDAAAGRPPTDDLYLPGVIRATLWPGEESTLTIIVSAEELATQNVYPSQLNLSYQRAVEGQQHLVHSAQQPHRFFGEAGEAAQARRISALPLTTTDSHICGEEFLRILLQAGNRFVVQYRLPQREFTDNLFFHRSEKLPLILSGYYSLENRTRDTLIALPGLLLTTQRYDEALRILRALARHLKQGLLPDRSPLPHSPLQDSDYGSVDTTLWYFYALDHYLQATQHYEFLTEVYGPLSESINWYQRGTDNGIQVDMNDGQLQTKQAGKALTWMNGMVDGVPVTPRYGKAVEVNALWYHALCLMKEWSQILYRMGQLADTPAHFQEQLALCKESFQRRFWYKGAGNHGGYLYDVVDGPEGDDPSLRPNQLFACSLRYPVLDAEYRMHVFDTVTRYLATPYGLRTLAPNDAHYQGRVGKQQRAQQQALHQGSVWSWLIGPYLDTMLAVGRHTHISSFHAMNQKFGSECQQHRDIQLLEPFLECLGDGLIGMNGGVFDGNAPHAGGYCAASAIGNSELIRCYDTLARKLTLQPVKVSV